MCVFVVWRFWRTEILFGTGELDILFIPHTIPYCILNATYDVNLSRVINLSCMRVNHYCFLMRVNYKETVVKFEITWHAARSARIFRGSLINKLIDSIVSL